MDKRLNGNKMKHKQGFTLAELIVTVILIALMLWFVRTKLIHIHPIPAYHKTDICINTLTTHINMYHNKYNKWPNETKWEEQLLSFTGDLETEHYFLDGWKNPIQYRIVEKDGIQTVLLYSFGKNKTDDNGSGDDIIREVEIPTSEEIDNYKANTEAAVGGEML